MFPANRTRRRTCPIHLDRCRQCPNPTTLSRRRQPIRRLWPPSPRSPPTHRRPRFLRSPRRRPRFHRIHPTRRSSIRPIRPSSRRIPQRHPLPLHLIRPSNRQNPRSRRQTPRSIHPRRPSRRRQRQPTRRCSTCPLRFPRHSSKKGPKAILPIRSAFAWCTVLSRAIERRAVSSRFIPDVKQVLARVEHVPLARSTPRGPSLGPIRYGDSTHLGVPAPRDDESPISSKRLAGWFSGRRDRPPQAAPPRSNARTRRVAISRPTAVRTCA
jgi:hypothetical protein